MSVSLDLCGDWSRVADIAQLEPPVVCVCSRSAQPQPGGGTSRPPVRNAPLVPRRAAFESPFPSHWVAIPGKVLLRAQDDPAFNLSQCLLHWKPTRRVFANYGIAYLLPAMVYGSAGPKNRRAGTADPTFRPGVFGYCRR